MTLHRLVRALTLGVGIAYLACGDEAAEPVEQGDPWDCEVISERGAPFCDAAWTCNRSQRTLELECEYEGLEEGFTDCDCYENGIRTGGFSYQANCSTLPPTLEGTNAACDWELIVR